MADETVVVNDVPERRLQDTIDLRRLDGWHVRAINVQPDGEYTVVFKKRRRSGARERPATQARRNLKK